MGPDGLNEFARYFYPQLDKEALIIDDRANGGGNVSPMIIERLLRRPYRLTMSRTSTKVGTIPDATLVGPKVLLINKYSASDGGFFYFLDIVLHPIVVIQRIFIVDRVYYYLTCTFG